MKGIIAATILFFLLLLCIPMIAMNADQTEPVPTVSSASSVVTSSLPPDLPSSSQIVSDTMPEEKVATTKDSYPTFKILDKSSSKIIEVTNHDFLFGAIVTEMSPESPVESLKAQAVAAYTYYSRLRLQGRNKGLQSDFEADPKNWKIYVSIDQMKERWGDQFEGYYKKLEQAVNAVEGQTLEKDGELICATYYAISSGKTEAAVDIWGGNYSYLVPVASPGDLFASGYQTTVTKTMEESKKLIEANWKATKLDSDASKWFGKPVKTDSGSVESITIGSETVKGSEVRSVFGLRSANFVVSYADQQFTFTVKGYGHGVGMSQCGASYMASQGSTYQEILLWYYPGTKLIES